MRELNHAAWRRDVCSAQFAWLIAPYNTIPPYAVKQNQMNIDGKQVRLAPGMAVNVEVKTGQRRIIEYFLSPLISHVSESVRER